MLSNTQIFNKRSKYLWIVIDVSYRMVLSVRACLMSIDDGIFFVKIELWIVCFLRRLNINVLIFTNHYYDVYWRMLNHCVYSHCPAKIPKNHGQTTATADAHNNLIPKCVDLKKEHISFKILCHIVITCNL